MTLLSTPLYSNTTLVCFFPPWRGGGTVVLMKKFDAGKLLRAGRSGIASPTPCWCRCSTAA